MNTQQRIVAAAAVLLGGGLVAIAQEQPPQKMPDMKQGDNAAAKQQVEDVAKKRESERGESGGRMVQVPEKALFGFGELPRLYMHKAVEDLEKEPGHVRQDINMVANIYDLDAARTDGPAKEQMQACARTLYELAEKVETRQILAKDDLEKPFAKALHTLAGFETDQAKMGLKQKDAERIGWGVRMANYDLAESLVYAKQNPEPTVSKALFNADTLGEQLIHLAKPTTGQLEARGDDRSQPAGDRQPPDVKGEARRGTEPLNGTNQVAQAEQMPREAEQVVADLDNALQRTGQQVSK